MVRKRPSVVVDISSSGDSENAGFEDVQCSQLPSMDYDSYQSFSETQVLSEDGSSSDNSSFNHHLYQKCLRDYKKIKQLKRRLQMALNHKSKRLKFDKNTKDGFTRFSATTFMNVISALSPERKALIESYGFGSLLMFKKCFVPKKFTNWVARLVDYKSGDIICDGKVISLTEESVHLVLDIPVGGKPFPSDSSVGKAVVLSKFGKDRIPPVSFFVDKLMNTTDMSDEDIFVCFMVVALSSFLCPNSNITPSPKYFGVFEDIEHIKEFNWSGYVLQWLLDHIKAFNRGKNDKLKRCQALGGCIYYLAVVYLDHIDFRQIQVADSIPRISVWKDNMIQFYSNLDLKSPGVYGYRPLLEFEKTCYYKRVRVQIVGSADGLDAAFCEKLEAVSGCKLPLSLKVKISRLIDEHCFNCGVSFNIDVTSLANVSKEFQDMFAKLMQHVCTIDDRTKDLVLELMKSIAEANPTDGEDDPSFGDASRENVADEISDRAPEDANRHTSRFSKAQGFVPQLSKVINVPNKDKVPANVSSNSTKSEAIKVVHLSKDCIDLDKEEPMQKLNKSSATVLSQRLKAMPSTATGNVVSGVNASVRNPLVNISNVASTSAGPHKFPQSDKDVILIDKENLFVPDSVSPSPVRYRSRLISSKVSQNSENASPNSTDPIPILMQTIPFSDDESPHITPNLSRKPHMFSLTHSSAKRARSSSLKGNDTSPVHCTGSRAFADNVRVQTKKSEDIYNSDLDKLRTSTQTPELSLRKTHGFPCDYSIDPEAAANRSNFKISDSSTGGKVPHHGPRRMVCPSRFRSDDFVFNGNEFNVSKSQISNYKAICALAKSRSSNEDALYFGGVRCTYWSLDESLKPGGQVNNFVVAAFCYHLFCRPDGHPDVSKRHYFFSNISDNLLKDHDEVAQDVMMRAFNRSRKARPLPRSDLPYFPTFYENHWFVFVVDIKDKKFVFLDSYFNQVHEYQEYVREKMILEFQFWWDKYVNVDMKFNEYGVIYPSVSKQPVDNNVDSRVYCMMFLEHWTSPRSSLFSLFTSKDIPNIRIKLANEMVFNPRNSGKKNLVITYDHMLEDGSE